MPDSAAAHPAPPRLAQAFLALGDDGVVRNGGWGPAAIVATVAATLVLALSAPLAWAATGATPKPSDQPSATAVSKAALPAPDDDDGGG